MWHWRCFGGRCCLAICLGRNMYKTCSGQSLACFRRPFDALPMRRASCLNIRDGGHAFRCRLKERAAHAFSGVSSLAAASGDPKQGEEGGRSYSRVRLQLSSHNRGLEALRAWGGPETLEPRCEQPQALLTHKPWRLRRACISGTPRISEYPTQQQDSLPCARGGAAHDSACDATRLRGARCRSVRARAACAHCWGKRQPESLSRSRQASTW